MNNKMNFVVSITNQVYVKMENYYSNDSKEYPNLVEDGNGEEAGLIPTENGVVTGSGCDSIGTDDIKQDFIGISSLIANNDLQYQKPPIDMIPANNNFPGQFNFELIMNTSSKFSWVVSLVLFYLFIYDDSLSRFSIRF